VFLLPNNSPRDDPPDFIVKHQALAGGGGEGGLGEGDCAGLGVALGADFRSFGKPFSRKKTPPTRKRAPNFGPGRVERYVMSIGSPAGLPARPRLHLLDYTRFAQPESYRATVMFTIAVLFEGFASTALTALRVSTNVFTFGTMPFHWTCAELFAFTLIGISP